MMLFGRLLSGCGLMGMLCAVVCAGTIQDPAMGMEGGDFSDPITTGTNFVPNNGGGVFAFFNPNSSFITSLIFQTSLLPGLGLTPAQINQVFVCNDQFTPGHANPFFLNCSIKYDDPTGKLTISFFGVNPENETDSPFDNELGEREGIPPLAPPCLPPAAAGCSDRGHFIITLNDNFSTDPANPAGGWVVSSGRDNVFPPGGPIFGVAEIDVAPEPAAALLQALALLGLAAFARYRNRSRAQTRNMSMRNS